MMKPDEAVLSMIAGVVHGARERNEASYPPSYPTRGMGIPDPREVLDVRCGNEKCERPMRRTRRVVEVMNGRYGFVPCSKKCREKGIAAEKIRPQLLAYPLEPKE